MITIRGAGERGRFDFGWLKTAHTFSFGEYRDPRHMGFRSLRVINEDHVAPGTGFDLHPHQHMEIITVVLSGAIRHGDSLGNRSILREGEVQRMSAGTGIHHSEHNASATEPLHLLQIWLRPESRDIEPSYEQKSFADGRGPLTLLVSREGAGDSLRIHQDARLYLARDGARIDLAPGRAAWIQVMRGSIRLNGTALAQGDGAAVESEPSISLDGEGEALVFDLA